MAAGSTYTPIATTTLGSAAASYTFSSIAGTYTDLVVIFNGAITTGPDDVRIQFNGDTASNYSATLLRGSGTATLSASSSNDTVISYTSYIGTGDGSSVGIFNIMNYSNATTYKTIICRGNVAASFVNATTGLWRNTAAITSVKMTAGGSTFKVGSTFTLYGISAA
jgi:hypothetical protein